MNFVITEKEGIKYSKISGDYNKLHLDNLVGYNSIFGEKICHGCYVVTKFLKLLKLDKKLHEEKNFSLIITFLKYFKYNYKIKILKKKNVYYLYQNETVLCEIKILLNNENKILGINKNTKLVNKKKIISKNQSLFEILNTISKYVGMNFPGKNSLIRNIEIMNKQNKDILKKKNLIYSYKTDLRHPIIYNHFETKKYFVNFSSVNRPFLKEKKIKPNSILKNQIKKLNKNVLILGASQGLGKRMFDLVSYNKKIKKIVTYNKNKIKKKGKYIIPRKLNIFYNLNDLINIIKNNNPLIIFYFISPKILLNKHLSPEIRKLYKSLYINYPLEILKKFKDQNISMFYPSSIYVNEKKNIEYSKIKKLAEEKIKLFCYKNNIPLVIPRLPVLNSKQSISTLNDVQTDFIEYLNNDKDLIMEMTRL